MNLVEFKKKAKWARQQALLMQVNAGKGHLGGAFSIIDLLVGIYYSGFFKVGLKFKNNPTRDRLILSKGHACLSIYPILADLGFFPKDELLKYGLNGTILGGHPDHFIPGVDVSTGSLGHGLGVGAGLALGAKLNSNNSKTFVVIGDGECNEGSIWEGIIFAKAQKLNNLIAIVDNNRVGATDFTSNFTGDESLASKWRSFGWDVIEINGHDFSQIIKTLKKIKLKKSENPLAIVAQTIKGKGVSFMENDYHWHHGVVKGDLIQIAKNELGLEK